ncbi:MAG: hypothetical protein FWF81_04775, partial [Defluviitaleaceae bacterium]|nr:hypothetical protein [Defluviitaleaceae bacterium]
HSEPQANVSRAQLANRLQGIGGALFPTLDSRCNPPGVLAFGGRLSFVNHSTRPGKLQGSTSIRNYLGTVWNFIL